MSVACIRVIDALLARIKVLIARPDNTNNSDTISCSGDYFLQLCAPLEALEYYAVSIEEERRRLRDTGKTTLLSNRLEGFAMAGTLVAQLEILQDDRIRKEFQRSLEHIMQRCSLTFQSDKNLDLSPDEMTPSAPILHDEEKRLGQMVISALHEALDLHVQYTRVASEARCALKLAAVVADAYLRGHRSHGEIDIWDMLLRAVGTEGLTASQSVTCLVLGSQLCVRIGLRRKAALLLYMAGLVSADAVGPLASTLFANAGELYGVTGTRVDALAWRKMRCELLAYTSYTTRQADLPMDSIRYVCELVQLMGFTEAWAVESVGPYLDGVTYSNSEEENLKGAYLVPTERHLSSSITPFGLPTAKLSSGRLSTESPSMRRSFAPSVGGDSSNISSFRPIHSPLQSLSRSANRQSKSFSTKSASHRDTSNKSFVKFPTPDLNRQKNSLVAFRVRMESRLKQVARASLEPFKIDRDSNSNVISRASTIVANVNSYGTDYSPPVDALTSLHGLLESSCPTLEMQQQAVQMLQDGANLLSDAGEFVDLPLPLFSCRLVAISLVSQSHRQSAAVISSLRSSILTTLSEDKERSIDQPVPEITKGLFYDPFADKRVRTKDDSLQQGCQLWCVGAICFVSVSLCNPLSTHVSFSCVQPVFEGERVEDVQLFEQSLLIPANSAAFVVQLRVRPQERGNLKLAGLRLCIGKTERIIYVDENGSFK